jgi:hypothetical protein
MVRACARGESAGTGSLRHSKLFQARRPLRLVLRQAGGPNVDRRVAGCPSRRTW